MSSEDIPLPKWELEKWLRQAEGWLCEKCYLINAERIAQRITPLIMCQRCAGKAMMNSEYKIKLKPYEGF